MRHILKSLLLTISFLFSGVGFAETTKTDTEVVDASAPQTSLKVGKDMPGSDIDS